MLGKKESNFEGQKKLFIGTFFILLWPWHTQLNRSRRAPRIVPSNLIGFPPLHVKFIPHMLLLPKMMAAGFFDARPEQAAGQLN